MSKHIVLITNDYDEPLNLLVTFPVIGKDKWKTLDKGIWRYHGGACYLDVKTKFAKLVDPTNADTVNAHKHLVLCNTPAVSSGTGVIFYDFKGWTSVNDSGAGILWNNWSIASVTQFKFTWQLVD